MLNDRCDFSKVYIACGRTDLRKGIDGLSAIINLQFRMDPYQENVLFMFCGRSANKIKCLLWEGDGFLLLYKRLQDGAFQWPRNKREAQEITPEQYHWLMSGLSIVGSIRKAKPKKLL